MAPCLLTGGQTPLLTWQIGNLVSRFWGMYLLKG
jgi:hypothetical protein